MVSDVEKHKTGRWDTREFGEGFIFSGVTWEGLTEKLIFEERPNTGKGAIPVAVYIAGGMLQARDLRAKTEAETRVAGEWRAASPEA